MDSIPIILVCFVPILFLSAFVGYEGKKYFIYLLWGFLACLITFGLYSITGLYPSGPPLKEILIAPVIEEFIKALPIMVLAGVGIKNSNRDLLVCAMAIGIGFSIVETGWYCLDGNLGFTPENIMDVLSRSFSTALMHGCTTAIIGYGVVLVRNIDRGALPILMFGFYTLAVTLHAIFNLLNGEVYNYKGGAIVDFLFPMALFYLLLICYRVDFSEVYRTGERV